MATVASLKVHIGADITRFSQTLRRAERMLRNFQRAADRDILRNFKNDLKTINRDIDSLQSKTARGIQLKVDRKGLSSVKKDLRDLGKTLVIPVRAKVVEVDAPSPVSVRASSRGGGRLGSMLTNVGYGAADLLDSRLLGQAVSMASRSRGGAAGLLGLGALGAAGIGVGIPIAAAIPGARLEYQFDKVMARTNASIREQQQMIQSAMDLAASSTKSMMDIARLQEFLGGAGWDPRDIINLAPGVVTLSEATGDDLQITGEVMSALMRNFKIAPSRSRWMADLIAQAANVSAIDTESLWFLNKYAGARAAGLGIDARRAFAAQMVLEDLGMNKESAARYFGGGLGRLAAPTAKAREWFNRLGIDLFDDRGRMLPLENVIEELRRETAGLSQRARTQFFKDVFGEEAGRGWQRLVENPDRFRRYLGLLSDDEITGQASERAKKLTDNLLSDLERLGGELEKLAYHIFGETAPWMRETVQGITRWLEKINELFDLKNIDMETFRQLPEEMKSLVGELQSESWFSTLMRGMFGEDSLPHEIARAIDRGDWTTVEEKFGEIFGRILLNVVENLPYETIGEIMGEHFFETLAAFFKGLSEGFREFFKGIGLPDWLSQFLGWLTAAAVMLPVVTRLVTGLKKVFWDFPKRIVTNIVVRTKKARDNINKVREQIQRLTGKKIKVDADTISSERKLKALRQELARLEDKKIKVTVEVDYSKSKGFAPTVGKSGSSKKGGGGRPGGDIRGRLLGFGSAGGAAGGAASILGLGGYLTIGHLGNYDKMIDEYNEKVYKAIVNTKNLDKEINKPAFKPTNLTEVEKNALAAYLQSDHLDKSLKDPANKQTNLAKVAGDASNVKSKSDIANSSLAQSISKNTNLDSIADKASGVKQNSDLMNSSLGRTITKTVNIVANWIGRGWNWLQERIGGLWHSGGIIPKHHSGVVRGAGTQLAQLWGGEMVLTRQQQAWLFDLLRYRRGLDERNNDYPAIQQAIQAMARAISENQGNTTINVHNYGCDTDGREVAEALRRKEWLDA